MKTLYLDCFSGISGNMFIGMLIQAGVPFEAFKQAMASLNLTGYDLVCHSVNKLPSIVFESLDVRYGQ